MKALMDIHTHTASSGHHTDDTITDLAKKAFSLGLNYLGISDHAPAMIGSAKESYFRNLKFCEKKKFGVNILYGVELNILDESGRVDLPSDILTGLDYAIASLHKDITKPQGEAHDTNALINAMKNPFVNIIGHPDDMQYSINMHSLTDAAREYGVILEVNSVGLRSDSYRGISVAPLVEMLTLCKKKDVYISLGSDSHGKEFVGDFKNSYTLLKEVDFPETLIVNHYPNLFFELVTAKHKKSI